MTTARHTLFSNATEFMFWQERNCERCVKAVWYNPKRDSYPTYRCAVQRHIELAAVTDGKGSKRDYEAVSAPQCPYLQTKRRAAARETQGQPTLQL